MKMKHVRANGDGAGGTVPINHSVGQWALVKAAQKSVDEIRLRHWPIVIEDLTIVIVGGDVEM